VQWLPFGKFCFLILNPHTQLTTSLITVVSHSNSCGGSKNENNFGKIVKFLVIKPLNLVIFKLIELVIFYFNLVVIKLFWCSHFLVIGHGKVVKIFDLTW